MINVELLAEKVLQSYKETKFNPCKHRYFDHLTGCCCPLVAVYLNECPGVSKETFNYEEFMEYMKRLLGENELYVRTIMKGIDELPENLLGLKDDKNAYRLGCKLRGLIFQEKSNA